MRCKSIVLALVLAALSAAFLSPGTPSRSEGQPALRIGLLLPFSGDLALFGPPLQNAANLAAKHVNEHGGVLGGDVQIVVGDSATSPEVGVQEALRLITQEGVSVIVGELASGVSLAVAENATVPNGVLQVSPASTSPALTSVVDNDLLFRTCLSDAAQGKVLGDLAWELGYQAASTLYLNNPYGQGLSDMFAARFTELGGQVLAAVPHEQDQASYLPQLEQATASDPDVLAAISYPQDAITYLNEAIGNDLIDEFLFVDGTKSQGIIDAVGADHLNGMYGVAPAAAESAAGDAFDAAYEAEYGAPPPLPYAKETYDAVVLAAFAAEAVGSTDSGEIRNALRRLANPPGEPAGLADGGIGHALDLIRATQDIDYRGASGMVDFDGKGDVTSGAIEIWRIEEGQIVTVRIEPVAYAGAPLSTAGIGSGVVAPGHNATVPLEALDVPSPGLGAFTIDIAYDPTVVSPLSYVADPGALFDSLTCNLGFEQDGSNPDVVRCGGFRASAGATGDLSLADITFGGIGASGSESPLALNVVELADTLGQAIPITTEYGTITVGALGDANGDGHASMVDAMLIAQCVVGLIDCGEINEEMADVNCDGRASMVDAMLIAQKVVGLIDVFPCGSP